MKFSSTLPGLLIFLFSCVFILNTSCNEDENAADSSSPSQNLIALLGEPEWMAPDFRIIPKNEYGDLIRYGRELIANTGAYYGPHGKISHAANGMNCQNCHLNAGTKLYANSFSAVYSIYPKLRPRSGTVENLVKRINDCMERSMNGEKLDSTSREVQAMIAYINWVGKDVAKGKVPEGASVVDLKYLDRPADPERGKADYQKYCVSCHGADGKGILDSNEITYLYPPLWGPNSYNTAAGLYRLSRFAGFIKSNMPHLTSNFANPTLTDEQSWDIAAYVNSMPRPEKKFPNDWPDISKKPYDHPYGPFADKYSDEQHKYGPFKEIIASIKKQSK